MTRSLHSGPGPPGGPLDSDEGENDRLHRRLAVIPGDVVVECVHGRVPLECGVASVMVVAVEEACKGHAAVRVARVRRDPGPFVLEGEVEPLDLAVGLGPVRAVRLSVTPASAAAVRNAPER